MQKSSRGSDVFITAAVFSLKGKTHGISRKTEYLRGDDPPIVGLEMGAIWTALAWLCTFLHLPALVTGLILCAYP